MGGGGPFLTNHAYLGGRAGRENPNPDCMYTAEELAGAVLMTPRKRGLIRRLSNASIIQIPRMHTPH